MIRLSGMPRKICHSGVRCRLWLGHPRMAKIAFVNSKKMCTVDSKGWLVNSYQTKFFCWCRGPAPPRRYDHAMSSQWSTIPVLVSRSAYLVSSITFPHSAFMIYCMYPVASFLLIPTHVRGKGALFNLALAQAWARIGIQTMYGRWIFRRPVGFFLSNGPRLGWQCRFNCAAKSNWTNDINDNRVR